MAQLNTCDRNTLWPGHFINNNFKRILCKEVLNFVHEGTFVNKWPLIQVMAWCWTGGKPLSEPMVTQFVNVYTSSHFIVLSTSSKNTKIVIILRKLHITRIAQGFSLKIWLRVIPIKSRLFISYSWYAQWLWMILNEDYSNVHSKYHSSKSVTEIKFLHFMVNTAFIFVRREMSITLNGSMVCLWLELSDASEKRAFASLLRLGR